MRYPPFNAAQERRRQAEAAKGRLSAGGLNMANVAVATKGRGSTLESVFPDYATTRSSHEVVASNYAASKHVVQLMMQAACTTDRSIPTPPPGIWDG